MGPGAPSTAPQEIARVKGVTQADPVMGSYDVIARVEAPSLDELANIVVTGIQSCTGVTRTLVCAVPQFD